MTGTYLRATLFFTLIIGVALVFVAVQQHAARQETRVTPISDATAATSVPLVLLDDRGEFVGPINAPRVELTEDEWRERLTDEQFRILRNDGTERAFCGNLLDNKKEGVYRCAGCGLPLFASTSKFTSGTGWPSFFQPVAEENVLTHEDRSFGMVRVEIVCARCDGHLGHVFPDGPKPTGLRFCVNSESLTFTEQDQLASVGEVSQAVFAGGCFWCTEAVFEQLEGVLDVESGYAGGDDPTSYKEVMTGKTGHAESIRIVYDPKVISYEQLLEIHFATHDPTTINRQGNDVGPQYRSAIFYADERQKQAAEAYIAKLEAGSRYSSPIVTTLEPLDFYQRAEDYHQDYARLNPDQPYIRAVSRPKAEKARKLFPELLKGVGKDEPDSAPE
ncbi:MAG: bifunctional methionine sulfoxide reductase B/A protein [Phycisphaerales bacterium]